MVLVVTGAAALAGGGLIEELVGGEAPGELDLASGMGAGDPLVAALLNGKSPAVDMDPLTADYLEKQTHLIEIQSEHLDDQRAIQLSQLKIRYFTDLMRAGVPLVIVLVAVGVVGILGIMIMDAANSRSVVIEGFKRPALISRGMSGEVVATSVLDALQKLQDATRATARG